MLNNELRSYLYYDFTITLQNENEILLAGDIFYMHVDLYFDQVLLFF